MQSYLKALFKFFFTFLFTYESENMPYSLENKGYLLIIDNINQPAVIGKLTETFGHFILNPPRILLRQNGKEISNIFSQISNNRFDNQDFQQFDCFICVILSYHINEKYVASNKREINFEEIITSLNSCEQLKNKPKLFFLQAYETSEPRSSDNDNDDDASPDDSVILPISITIKPDFFFAFSNVFSNRVSIDELDRGHFFFQMLCENIETNTSGLDICVLMRKINQEILLKRSLPEVFCFISMLVDECIFMSV